MFLKKEAEMPAKVLPSSEEFERSCRWFEARGFRRVSRQEFKKDFVRLGLKAPSPREGREAGFVFHANGLEVVVWTTFLPRENYARGQDAGWVLIKEGDDVKYFTHPLHRTEGFLRRLRTHARIAQLRAMNRPLCPECHARMNIVRGKGFKARYWRCARPGNHKEAVTLPWDYGLPAAAVDFLTSERKRRARYAKKLAAAGKKPGTALRRRRGWKIGRPENVVPSR
ncbi:MAG TPA: hypothetical protein VMV50_00145 [Candidatus Paceibacterota bacterium]|nr:hypothetical protein [Candidatus Paceibacterota bacterium]